MMKNTIFTMILAGLFFAGGAAAQDGKKKEAAGGAWKSLFDGKSLKGWDGDPQFWTVKDGALAGVTTKEKATKKNTFLIYVGENADKKPVEFGDFELKVEFRIVGHNSGIQYRSAKLPGPQDGWRVGGYQADFDVTKEWVGANYEEKGRGLLAKRGEKSVVTGSKTEMAGKNKKWKRLAAIRTTEVLGDPAALAAKVKDAPEWNEFHIIAKGNHLVHKVNGVLMSEVKDDDAEGRRAKGLIAIQLHSGPPMTVEVRKVEIKTEKK